MNLCNQNLFQVLIIVDVEAVGIVKDVSDEKPTEKCHLNRDLGRAKMMCICKQFPNRDDWERLHERPQYRASLLLHVFRLLGHAHAHDHPYIQSAVQCLKVFF